MPETDLLISCEHAVNAVPAPYRHLFAGQEEVLESHRGFDPGAAELAERLGAALAAPVFRAEVTRLLVDLNRSLHHRALWSSFSRALPPPVRQQLLETYYQPFRCAVADRVAASIAGGARVVHLSVHSFTPVLAGRVRRADVGLLYDPSRTGETRFCRSWQHGLRALAPGLRVLRNAPYRGRSDCHQNALRRCYPDRCYLAIELEVNQRLLEDARGWGEVTSVLLESLRRSCAAG